MRKLRAKSSVSGSRITKLLLMIVYLFCAIFCIADSICHMFQLSASVFFDAAKSDVSGFVIGMLSVGYAIIVSIDSEKNENNNAKTTNHIADICDDNNKKTKTIADNVCNVLENQKHISRKHCIIFTLLATACIVSFRHYRKK